MDLDSTPGHAAVPKLLYTVTPTDNVDAVIGLGVIDDVIYVVRSWTSNIETYSTVSQKPKKAIQVLSLDLPHDMVACIRQKCLYLSDYGPDIHRIETAGYCLQTKWSAMDRPTGLCLAGRDGNVVVTYETGQKVREFTSRGQLLHEFELPTEVLNPHQCCLLASSQLLTCHGFESDALNRVCLFDSAAKKIVRSLGISRSAASKSSAGDGYLAEVVDYGIGEMGYQLTQPIRIATNLSHGMMYVADFKNDRVLVVSLATFAVQAVLTSSAMRRPYRVCVDGNGLLYVGSWETGQVLVYNTC